MALTCQQIVTLATQIAKCPGFVTQAGQMFNIILQELCQDYDFAVAKGIYAFNFTVVGYGNNAGGGSDFNPDFNTDFGPAAYAVPTNCGPFLMPADWLRAARNDVFYTIDGDPHVMVNIDNAQFDAMIQQTGTQSYPEYYTTVLLAGNQPAMYVWPPPSGAYPVTVRYQRQMPDYDTPQTNVQVPWFPNTNYLVTRLAGEMMKIVNDKRSDTFLGEGPGGAQGILKRYLKLKDDDEDRTRTVSLDRRQFSPKWSSLPSTKAVGFP